MERRMGNDKYMSADINRRKVLINIVKGSITGALLTTLGNRAFAIESDNNVPPHMPDSVWTQMRGFNYQPSYGSNGFELWQKFDAKIIETELAQGKHFFPKMNIIRWWQSWDAFLRDPERYGRNFTTTLELAEKVGCQVMPCLFNRWHDKVLDYGGIYIDHFLPNCWVWKDRMFHAFLEGIVGQHSDDPRIVAWDLCNEPYTYSQQELFADITQAETVWLKSLYDICKDLGAQAPITVGIHPGMTLERLDPVCDLLSIHPYWIHDRHNASKEDFEKGLDASVAFALKTNKPLMATECCWGSLDDKTRADSIRYTLSQLKQRNIGWTCYLLHHSLIADAHRPEFGPVGPPGNLAFIEANGTLRNGHEVFNEF
ncbi:MAG: cellulase family glycosylhydrolase [Prolixibacteraceae bacterium]|nr:cellulase family glycosylhydrolase [Prolixibacteraceae bacterium]